MDFKKLCLEILRDLYGSSRRLSMYPLGHPVTQETLKKPLDMLNKVFSLKHSFTMELFNNMLLAEGICLEDTIYVSGLALDLKKHKLSNIRFSSQLNIGDLYHILVLLISKPGPYDDNVARVLKSKNIDCIEVNIDNAPRLFNFDKTGVAGDPQQFSLSRRTRNLIIKHPNAISAYYMGRIKTDEDIQKWINVDFRLGYLLKYFKDALCDLGPEKGKQLLEDAVYSTNWLDDDIPMDSLKGLQQLFSDFLSRYKEDKILSEIYELFKKVGAPNMIMEQIFDKTSVLKLRTFQESEVIVNTLKYSDPSQVDPAGLKKTIFKLAASDHKNYLVDLLDQLLKSLSSPTNELRQKGLHLAVTAGEVLSKGGFRGDFNYLCRESIRLSLLPSDSLVPIELTAELAWQSLKKGFWQELKFLAKTLKGLREDKSHPVSKRNIASEKITEIAESSLLSDTFTSLLEKGWSEETSGFFDAFSNLGARGIVRILAERITHPNINMRSRAIKLLVSMKKDSADILSQILGEQVEKYDGTPLDDEQWYFYRNILRVLREVKAEESIPYIEIMTNWPDKRLKIEVIKTLEEMPAENSGKLLEKLASDSSPEIRKAAVVAMGLTGHPDMVPRLMNIFLAQPDCRINSIASIGRIGGTQARDKLIDIFEDDSYYSEYNISKDDSEQIKIAIIKALSRIGDNVSKEKLDEYSRSDLDKSLFDKELLSSTAKVILSGQ
ncbi:MAG: HEAT repeat domain-containing protein [candidate division Zixibacteria bacterium]